MSDRYMVKQILKFSDDSETVLNFNRSGEEISEDIAEILAPEVETPEISSEVSGTEGTANVVGEATGTDVPAEAAEVSEL